MKKLITIILVLIMTFFNAPQKGADQPHVTAEKPPHTAITITVEQVPEESETTAETTAGKKRPHLGLCPGPNVSLQGRQGSPVRISDSPEESGLALWGRKRLHSPLDSRRVCLGVH